MITGNIRLGLRIIFFFAGTVLHEFAHYCFAVLLGSAEGFSVIPKKNGDRIVLGSVKSRTRYKVLSSFIAAAPLIWWGVLFLLLAHSGFFRMNQGIPVPDLSPLSKMDALLTGKNFFFIWLGLQMLWAGSLSAEDIKNIFRGLFSVSGIFLIFIGAALLYILRLYSAWRV